jgi:hypothetical protein
MLARHRRPSRARILAFSAATGVTAAGAVAVVTASPALADQFSSIRQCESGGNYSTNTGNGFYGAYQFSQATWNSLGYSGTPSSASPATQDAAAAALASRSGFGQWPVCGAGYSGSSVSAPTSSATYSAPTSSSSSYSSTSYSAPAAPAAPAIAPSTGPFPTAMFSTALAGQKRQDVEYFQKRMNKLGYKIKTDGRYGQQSQDATLFFQYTHHLTPDGVVGPTTLAAVLKEKAPAKKKVATKKATTKASVAQAYVSQVAFSLQ